MGPGAHRVVCVAIGCVSAVAGCEAVLGLNGLSEGAGDAGTTDGTVPQDGAMVPRDGPLAADGAQEAGAADGGPYWTFSDGFETADLRYWTTDQNSGPGTIAVVDSGAYSGCCALHMTASPGADAFESAAKTWTSAIPSASPVQAGTIAVRLYVKATTIDSNSVELAVNQDGTKGVSSAQAGLKSPPDSGTVWGMFLVDPANPGGAYESALSPEAIPQASYECVEIVLNVSSVTNVGRFSVFIDAGAQPVATMTTDTTADAGWDTVLVGLPFSSGARASDLLIDNVTVSLYSDLSPTVHIGCP
jgi:hypothetical protein